MNARELYREFERFGWRVNVVETGGLVRVSRGGALLCGDGRASSSDRGYFFGPKIFGGVLGLAALIAMSEGKREFGIPTLAAAMNFGDHVPGMHDIHDDHVHCGQQIVAMQGGVYPKQNFTPQQGRDYALQYGGVQVYLSDEHAETEFGVNLREGTTRLPDSLDQRFWNDFWYLRDRVSEGVAVEASTKTIAALNSPVRNAVIYSRQ